MPQIHKSRPRIQGLALTKTEEFCSPLPDDQQSVYLPESRNHPPSSQNSLYPDECEDEISSGEHSILAANPLNKQKYGDKAFFGSAPACQPPSKTELPHSGEKKEGVPKTILKKLVPKKLKSLTPSRSGEQPYDDMILPPTVPTYQSSPKSKMSVQEKKSQMPISKNMKPFLAPACDDKCCGESLSQITKELPLAPELSSPKKIKEGKSKKPDPKPLPSSSDQPTNPTQIEVVTKGGSNQRESYQRSSESSLNEAFPGCFGLK